MLPKRSPCDDPLATKLQGDASIWLPQDVIAEILPRLPLKSLCRFRCVSRGWRTLISDPAVVSKHSHRTAEPLMVASCLPESCVRLFDLKGNLVRVIRGMGSFTKSISSRADHLACLIQGLGKAKVIDLATGEVLVTCSGGPVLAFGRALPSGLYKLLLFYRYGKCVILTVGDDVGWRKMRLPSTLIANHSDTVTINGVAYMFVKEHVNIIFPFDIESEEWPKRIRAPASILKEQYIKVSLGELGGTLCVGTTDDPYKTCGRLWEIWLLDDSFNSVWVKAYSIASGYDELTPLRVLPDSRKLFFYGHRSGGPVLQIYDPDDGTCTEVAKMPGDFTRTISLGSLHLERFLGVNI